MICSFDTPLLSDAESRSMSDTVAVTVTVSLSAWTPIAASTTVSWPSCTCAWRVTVCMPDRVNVTV